MFIDDRHLAGFRCAHALAWCLVLVATAATGANLADSARKENCADRPVSVGGGTIYKCTNKAGNSAYFNVDGAITPEEPPRKAAGNGKAATPSPAGFPRVDAETQKGRDDMRRKVLSDELAAEEKLLAQARADYGTGGPAPLPEEKADAEKYRQRIERLRQSVQLHERNVEALKKELGAAR